LAETNRLEAAEQILRRGIQHDAAANDFGHRTEKQLALAFLRFRAGDRASARVLSLDAVSGDPSVRQLSKSGSILAWAGFTGEAQQVLDRLRRSQDSPKIHEAILLVSGEIDLAKSRFREAIDQFEELDRIEAPLYHRLYLARAYRISGDRARAAERCRIAQKSPGLFWHFADYELPTLLSYTCSSIEEIQPTKKKE
jgi:tetratricopeptide (TPR) repeat protein